MVDFAKLARTMYESASPEERSRMDAYQASEARYNQTRHRLNAEFTRYASRRITDNRGKTSYETYPVREWRDQIVMRIEDRTDHTGREYEILRFIGGPTGHEAFEISEKLIRTLREDMPEGWSDRLTICGGSASYDMCWVSCEEVLDYLAQFRPEFFPDKEASLREKPAPAFLRKATALG